MAIIAIRSYFMRTVNVAELKNSLSKYLTFAKAGEEIVIRERNLPVAKLVPFSSENAKDDELALVAAGKLRLPTKTITLKDLLKIPTGKLRSNAGVKAILDERKEQL
jgi:prevent-host-death family protein